MKQLQAIFEKAFQLGASKIVLASGKEVQFIIEGVEKNFPELGENEGSWLESIASKLFKEKYSQVSEQAQNTSFSVKNMGKIQSIAKNNPDLNIQFYFSPKGDVDFVKDWEQALKPAPESIAIETVIETKTTDNAEVDIPLEKTPPMKDLEDLTLNQPVEENPSSEMNLSLGKNLKEEENTESESIEPEKEKQEEIDISDPNFDPTSMAMEEEISENKEPETSLSEESSSEKEAPIEDLSFDPTSMDLGQEAQTEEQETSTETKSEETPADDLGFDPTSMDLEELTTKAEETNIEAKPEETPAEDLGFDPTIMDLEELTTETKEESGELELSIDNTEPVPSTEPIPPGPPKVPTEKQEEPQKEEELIIHQDENPEEFSLSIEEESNTEEPQLEMEIESPEINTEDPQLEMEIESPEINTEELNSNSSPTEIDLTFLNQMLTAKAKHMHLCPGKKVLLRNNSSFEEMGQDILSEEEIYTFLNNTSPYKWQESKISTHYVEINSQNFRIHSFHDVKGWNVSIEHLESKIPTVKDLKIPQELLEFCEQKQGLMILVSSSSQTLSKIHNALLNHLNTFVTGKILSIESPIKHVHKASKALISQKEMGTHSPLLEQALNEAAKENADIILCQNISNTETVKQCVDLSRNTLVICSMQVSSLEEAKSLWKEENSMILITESENEIKYELSTKASENKAS